LDEDNGNTAFCSENKYNGVVSNPQWLSAFRSQWKNTLSASYAGRSKSCFNSSNNSLLLLNEKELSQINLLTTSREVIDTLDFNLMESHWNMIKHPSRNLLVFYDVSNSSTILYNLRTKKIVNHKINEGDAKSNYLKHNMWWSNGDSLLNVFGGYGHYRYKNACFALNIYTLEWEEKKLSGDKIAPRYLAASGDYVEDNIPYVYIKGGYGSARGEQMLAPKNYYDLYRINKLTYEVEKIFSKTMPDSSSVWAQSIVTKSKQLYALEFDNHKFNSGAQLVTGRMGKRHYTELGDKIPFLFHDVKSSIDISYSAKYKKLFCYTTHEEGDHTHLELFQIDFPPSALKTKPFVGKSNASAWWWLSVIVLIAAALLFFYLRRRGKRTEAIKSTTETSAYRMKSEEFHLSSIHFFGGLQIIDSSGKDISSKFSPLLKQLLIFIVVAQHQNSKGVSNKKLTDTFWYGMPESKARNNRAVNFTKLKQLFSEVGDIELRNQSGYWKIEIPESNVHFGFYEISGLLNSSSKDIDYGHFVGVLQKGRFLDGIEYEWLEEYKDKITSSIIDKLSVLLHDSSLGKDTGFVLSICDCILMYDSVDEDAIKVKCRTLQKLGRHKSAKNCFTKFTKEYKVLYGEDYKESFENIFS
jgi:two-component SAPR family response regulator